jgi:hypothetical protein
LKSSQNSLKATKWQNIDTLTHFESPKHLHQTIVDNPCFETAYLGKNVTICLTKKVAKNDVISFGYFVFSTNHNQLLKEV